jgi:hypothetical protein
VVVFCLPTGLTTASPYPLPVSLDARIESESAMIRFVQYLLLSKRVKKSLTFYL